MARPTNASKSAQTQVPAPVVELPTYIAMDGSFRPIEEISTIMDLAILQSLLGLNIKEPSVAMAIAAQMAIATQEQAKQLETLKQEKTALETRLAAKPKRERKAKDHEEVTALLIEQCKDLSVNPDDVEATQLITVMALSKLALRNGISIDKELYAKFRSVDLSDFDQDAVKTGIRNMLLKVVCNNRTSMFLCRIDAPFVSNGSPWHDSKTGKLKPYLIKDGAEYREATEEEIKSYADKYKGTATDTDIVSTLKRRNDPKSDRYAQIGDQYLVQTSLHDPKSKKQLYALAVWTEESRKAALEKLANKGKSENDDQDKGSDSDTDQDQDTSDTSDTEQE